MASHPPIDSALPLYGHDAVDESAPPPRRFTTRRITRVLIANRGEIAVRIIKTLRRMKIEAVAIYAENDAQAAHVRDADVAVRLSGNTIAETYLNADQILELAKSVSADAIIPGYGFLSENAEFASRVEAEGMIWVGPTPAQMSELGLKHRARSVAVDAGITVVPGSSGLLTSVEDALHEARRVGFPLMLKDTAGKQHYYFITIPPCSCFQTLQNYIMLGLVVGD